MHWQNKKKKKKLSQCIFKTSLAFKVHSDFLCDFNNGLSSWKLAWERKAEERLSLKRKSEEGSEHLLRNTTFTSNCLTKLWPWNILKKFYNDHGYCTQDKPNIKLILVTYGQPTTHTWVALQTANTEHLCFVKTNFSKIQNTCALTKPIATNTIW